MWPVADPVVLHGQVLQVLDALPGSTAYPGQVPSKLPVDSQGYVLPYIVLYAGLGGDLMDERDLSGLVDVGTRDWPFQTTCVGASSTICLAVARDVSRALTNLPVGGGFIKPAGYDTPLPLADNQVTPARYFLPLQWRLLTN